MHHSADQGRRTGHSDGAGDFPRDEQGRQECPGRHAVGAEISVGTCVNGG